MRSRYGESLKRLGQAPRLEVRAIGIPADAAAAPDRVAEAERPPLVPSGQQIAQAPVRSAMPGSAAQGRIRAAAGASSKRRTRSQRERP